MLHGSGEMQRMRQQTEVEAYARIDIEQIAHEFIGEKWKIGTHYFSSHTGYGQRPSAVGRDAEMSVHDAFAVQSVDVVVVHNKRNNEGSKYSLEWQSKRSNNNRNDAR